MVEGSTLTPRYTLVSSRWGEKRARRPLDAFAAGAGVAAQGVQPHGTALGAHGLMAGATVTRYDASS